MLAPPVADPRPEWEAALGVWRGYPGMTLPCDECAQMSQPLGEASASGVPLPAAHRLEPPHLRGGKASGTVLMPPMADPPAELKPSLHVLGGYVCMTFPTDEALQMAEPFREASLERVPRPAWEAPRFLEHTDLLRAQEPEPAAVPVVRRAVAEREIAYSIGVEDAGVSSLADVAVEQLEKLLEGDTEAALTPRLPCSAPLVSRLPTAAIVCLRTSSPPCHEVPAHSETATSSRNRILARVMTVLNGAVIIANQLSGSILRDAFGRASPRAAFGFSDRPRLGYGSSSRRRHSAPGCCWSRTTTSALRPYRSSPDRREPSRR